MQVVGGGAPVRKSTHNRPLLTIAIVQLKYVLVFLLIDYFI